MAQDRPRIPRYLKDTYSWAYLRPASIRFLEHQLVVNAILWGNYRRLQKSALTELRPGQRVFQPACVYGDFSARLIETLGPDGHLDIGDVAPIQVGNCHEKLRAHANFDVHLWDAAHVRPDVYDVVCCFFLLHEMPESYKHRVVDALLDAVPPGGKVVFIDYHGPSRWHPLKWIMRLVNTILEPYANALWVNEIENYSARKAGYAWSKRTYFGGLYQKVVAQRKARHS